MYYPLGLCVRCHRPCVLKLALPHLQPRQRERREPGMVRGNACIQCVPAPTCAGDGGDRRLLGDASAPPCSATLLSTSPAASSSDDSESPPPYCVLEPSATSAPPAWPFLKGSPPCASVLPGPRCGVGDLFSGSSGSLSCKNGLPLPDQHPKSAQRTRAKLYGAADCSHGLWYPEWMGTATRHR